MPQNTPSTPAARGASTGGSPTAHVVERVAWLSVPSDLWHPSRVRTMRRMLATPGIASLNPGLIAGNPPGFSHEGLKGNRKCFSTGITRSHAPHLFGHQPVVRQCRALGRVSVCAENSRVVILSQRRRISQDQSYEILRFAQNDRLVLDRTTSMKLRHYPRLSTLDNKRLL